MQVQNIDDIEDLDRYRIIMRYIDELEGLGWDSILMSRLYSLILIYRYI